MQFKNINISFFIIFFILVFFIIFPLNNIFDLTLIILFILLLINTKKYVEYIRFDNKVIILFILITSNLYFNNYYIIEKNGIFIPNKYNESQYKDYDSTLYQLLNNNFKKNFQNIDINCKDLSQRCWENTNLINIFSENYSYLNFKEKKTFIRKIKNIGHNNLSSARIGMINILNLNWSDWKENSKLKRNNAPYFNIYKFNSDVYSNSSLCWRGNAILLNNNIKEINNQEIQCIDIYNNLEILFYNFNSDLDVYLEKNYKLKLYSLIDWLTKILILFFFIKIFIKTIIIEQLYKLSSLVICSSLVIFYIYFTRDTFQYGYFPLDAGMDGLVHQGYSNVLSSHLINLNFIEFFRGIENIFYFMPGMRYILSIKNLLFDFNYYFTFLIITFLPILLYFILLELKFSSKFSLIFTIFFILLKIPFIGFSFSHFARGALTIYPETYAAFCFFVFFLAYQKKYFFISALFCFLVVFIRPNYLPIFIIYLFFQFYSFYHNREIKNLFKTILGLSLFLIIPLHNFIYSNGSLVLLTNSAFIPANLKINIYDYIYFFTNNEIKLKIINHLLNWITTGERNNILPYIINPILFINVLCFLLFFCKNKNSFLICLMSISTHIPLFFYINTGRYAYFPWLLLFLSNVIILSNYYEYFFRKNKKYRFN